MAASRQYNPKRQSPQRNNAKKKRSGASPARGNAAIPGWLWLVAGLGVGILVTSLWKLTDTGPAPAATRAERTQQTAARNNQPQRPAKPAAPAKVEEKAAAKPAEQTGTRFDFYTLLPEREVLVPSERELSAPAATPAATSPASAAAPATAAATVPTVYLLQAGSFRAPAEADRRRAQILLLGLEARVETVSANGDTWYRVHAGPFQAGDKLTQARALLSGEGIETLPLKQKPAG